MAATASERGRADQKPRSLFDLPADFFDSCRLLRSHQSHAFPATQASSTLPPPASAPSVLGPAAANDGEFEAAEQAHDGIGVVEGRGKEAAPSRWTCHTCKAEFDSLQDQRSHFKSDVHRLNVRLSIAGKSTIKEEDFHELGGDSLFEDIDLSSTSGSEDEFEKRSSNSGTTGKTRSAEQKMYFRLDSGDAVSVWKCLILDESEELLPENSEITHMDNAGFMSHVDDVELVRRLRCLVREPRDKTQLRIVLLSSGGHFAGCVFDGNSVIAHKTFHRYVVRAKAGKKQSSQDASGKAANSAGSSLRRYNEAAFKKEIHELLVTWKPYIDSSMCIFIYAPSKNRQMLFDGGKPPGCVIRHVPLTVRRPTLKEAKRIYSHLTHISYDVIHEGTPPGEEPPSDVGTEEKSNKLPNETHLEEHIEFKESPSVSGSGEEYLHSKVEDISLSPNEGEITPLHEAARSGDTQQILDLLEQGMDPCTKDPRGRTPYMLATEKEARNTFRRFMALNLDKWDWHAAKVPSPLTKELEESQAAKQAEKDSKKKAKAKELKKLRKAKEKAKAEAAAAQEASAAVSRNQAPGPASSIKPQQHIRGVIISKEEEQRRALAAEREKRAAAAERRITALNAERLAATTASAPTPSPSSGLEHKSGAGDVLCSCCNASLAGKVPFHRFNYKYCSTSCMYVHKEMLEDG